DTARSIRAIASSSDVDLMAGLGFQFSANYAMALRRQMADFGWTQQDFARAAVKNKRHGSLNPYAQFRTPVTEEDVLNSRLVAWPLTLYMCSSIGDGAAAAILCSADVAARHRSPPYVKVAACALRSAPFEDYRQLPAPSASQSASQSEIKNPRSKIESHWLPVAKEAYERAGLRPEDVHVAEVHDAMAPAELRLYHALGFCGPGEGARLLADGTTSIEGRLPVNPSGGLSARGHPVGATGLAQVAEIVWQLRGEAGSRQAQGPDGKGPRVGLAQNSGGNIEGHQAANSVIILAR
ncbi:MAG: thiolase family protein, partial [Chloroflexi bacterium]|nr:thiolase family protein [Chloroflexota bacterium]